MTRKKRQRKTDRATRQAIDAGVRALGKLQPIDPPSIKHPSIVDAVSSRDRAFFGDHPNLTHYVRPYVPGELPLEVLREAQRPLPTQDWWVLVGKVTPDLRTREPIPPLPDLPHGSTLIIRSKWREEPVEAWVERWD